MWVTRLLHSSDYHLWLLVFPSTILALARVQDSRTWKVHIIQSGSVGEVGSPGEGTRMVTLSCHDHQVASGLPPRILACPTPTSSTTLTPILLLLLLLLQLHLLLLLNSYSYSAPTPTVTQRRNIFTFVVIEHPSKLVHFDKEISLCT